MAKIVIDCADPNDFAAVVESAEDAAGSCTITYAKQHLEMQKAGTSKSQRESARIIAKDSGESEGAARKKIQRGLQEVAHDVPDQQSEEKTDNSDKNMIIKKNNTIPKPLCKICNKRVVKFFQKTKKRAEHGMCEKCRKEYLKLKALSEKPTKTEINHHHREVWKEINIKMSSLIEYVYQWGRSPVCIEQDLKNESKDNLRKLTNVINSLFEKGNRGKVIIMGDPEKNIKTGSWDVLFQDEKGKPYLIDFDTYHEAQEACLVFGGNNIFTIAAPREFNDFKNWSYDVLFNLGHYVRKITLMKSTNNQDQDRTIPYELPAQFGTSHYFDDPENIDLFKEWLYSKFPNHTFHVNSFTVQNHETNDFCKYERKKVGDSTKRMELKLTKLNGKSYKKCRIRNIMAAADGLAEHQCKVVAIENHRYCQVFCAKFSSASF